MYGAFYGARKVISTLYVGIEKAGILATLYLEGSVFESRSGEVNAGITPSINVLSTSKSLPTHS